MQHGVRKGGRPEFDAVRLSEWVAKASVSAARLPTNTTTHRHAVHRWFNFIAGFSPEFVDFCIATVPPDGLVLDPFAGCGTTLLTAQESGRPSIGYEPHPFFRRIASAKVSSTVTHETIDYLESVLLDGIRTALPISKLGHDQRTFLTKLFPTDSLKRLLGAREALMEANLGNDDLAHLVLSRVLDMCSSAQTDGIYKAPTSKKRPEQPDAAIRSLIGTIKADLVDFESSPCAAAVVHEKSSESMIEVQPGSVSVIVTSPPYLNNFDFAEMTRMYLYFWGTCASWGDITEKVRSKLVVNTTTSLRGHRDLQEHYRGEICSSMVETLDDVVAQLREQRDLRKGKKEYDLLVYPYFAQMKRILAQCQAALKNGAKIHIMVADAALYGIHVATPQWLAAMMSNIGFTNIACEKVRSRGDRWKLKKRDGSPVGLGEYYVSATRTIS